MGDEASGASHDRSPTARPVAVERSLLLCSSPRSGSTLLAEALRRSGRLGCPTEYFDATATYAECAARWSTTTMASYVVALHRYRTSDDGLLSAKLHGFQLRWMAEALGLLATGGDRPYVRERAALDLVFPHCRYVRVTRRDRDRQAVSWAIADQLDSWAHDDQRRSGTSADFTYDFDCVDRFRRAVDEEEAYWDALLGALDVDVMTVAYEDLVRSYPDTVVAVAAHAGVALACEDVPPPRLRRQADARSDEVLARYLADRRNLR